MVWGATKLLVLSLCLLLKPLQGLAVKPFRTCTRTCQVRFKVCEVDKAKRVVGGLGAFRAPTLPVPQQPNPKQQRRPKKPLEPHGTEAQTTEPEDDGTPKLEKGGLSGRGAGSEGVVDLKPTDRRLRRLSGSFVCLPRHGHQIFLGSSWTGRSGKLRVPGCFRPGAGTTFHSWRREGFKNI